MRKIKFGLFIFYAISLWFAISISKDRNELSKNWMSITAISTVLFIILLTTYKPKKRQLRTIRNIFIFIIIIIVSFIVSWQQLNLSRNFIISISTIFSISGSIIIIWIILKLWSKVRVKIKIIHEDYRFLGQIKLSPSKLSMDKKKIEKYIIKEWLKEIKIIKKKKSKKKGNTNNIGEYGENNYQASRPNAKKEVSLESKNFRGRADFIEGPIVTEVKTTTTHKYIDPYKKWLLQLSAYLHMSNKDTGLLICYSYYGGKTKERFFKTITSDSSIYNNFLIINKFISEFKNEKHEFVEYKPNSILEAFQVRKNNRQR